MASSRYDILLCSETLVSDMRRVGVAGSQIWSPCLVVPEQDASGLGDGGIRTRWIWSISPTQVECGCCEMLVFRVCGARQNLYVFSLHHNPDIYDRIVDCLLTSIAAVQAEDVHASFLFVGDLNGHHEWLGSTNTSRPGVPAIGFATVSGCDQLVVSLTHAHGGTLDLLMTDVPNLVRVSVVAPRGNSDLSSLSAVISMAQAVPHLCVSRKVFLKHQVNWNTVCGAMQDLPWHNIWSADNPVEVLNEHLLLQIGHFVPTKVIREGNKNEPWLRHAFGTLRQSVSLVPETGMFSRMQSLLISGGPLLSLLCLALVRLATACWWRWGLV